MGTYFLFFTGIYIWVGLLSADFMPNLIYSHNSVQVVLIDGDISGSIDIPAVKTQERRFRGSSYRSRSSSSSANNNDNENANRFSNSIVSAHPLSFKLPDDISGESVIIDQKNATFIPNVTPVTVGTVVQFVNDDPFFHNVFSLTPGSKFNIGRRPTGDVYSKQIEAPKWKVTGVGPISLFCDVHSQMNATILSLDTPYFTRVNEDGTYSLRNLPVGEYEIRVFNNNFDIVSKKVEVVSGKNIVLNFNLNS